MAYGYTSIHRVIDDLMHHPMLRDLTLERAVNYAADFIRIVGIPVMFTEKVEHIHIENYRGELPCDFVEVNQVRSVHKNIVYRSTTDSFHLSPRHEPPHHEPPFMEPAEGRTYKIQNRCIFTNVRRDDIEMAYQAMALDKDGFPLIPDTPQCLSALENYIKVKCFSILFDMGQITRTVYELAQQEYAWAVGQCTTSLISPTIDELEAITNAFTHLIPRMTEHGSGFKYSGSMEKLKNHRG